MATLKDQVAGWGGLVKKVATASKVDPADNQPADLASPESGREDKLASSIIENQARKTTGYTAKKAKLHQEIIARLDLGAVENLSTSELKSQLKELVNSLIDDAELAINEQERIDIITDLQNEILGLGPLEPLLADPTVSEIMVNGSHTIFVEKNGKIEQSGIVFDNDDHLMKIIDKIVSRVGRRIDEASPMADARLPDGSRVNAIIPPLALDGPALTIRRFSTIPLQLNDLISKNSLTPEMGELLAGMVKAKINILISGGTGSGKTTLLNILSSYIPDNERIITVEDTAELQLQQPHVVRLETRPPNIENQGEVSMRALVKNSLRMRPNRIVVGEVRGEEVIDMLQAMNTGHDGSLTTIHANNPRDALGRLENLMSMSGVSMPARSQRQQICSAIQVIVQANRLSDGTRKVTSISELSGMDGDVITMQEIFKFQQQGVNADGSVLGHFVATGIRPKIAELLKINGIDFDENFFNPKSDDFLKD